MEANSFFLPTKILVADQDDRSYFFFEKLMAHSGLKFIRVKNEKEIERMAFKGFNCVILNSRMKNVCSLSNKIKMLLPEMHVISYSYKKSHYRCECNLTVIELNKENFFREFRNYLQYKHTCSTLVSHY